MSEKFVLILFPVLSGTDCFPSCLSPQNLHLIFSLLPPVNHKGMQIILRDPISLFGERYGKLCHTALNADALILGTHEISQGIIHQHLSPVLSFEHLKGLKGMGMRADDRIRIIQS